MSHAFNSRLSSDAAAATADAATDADAASGFSHVVADVLLTTLTSPDFIGGAILFPALFFFARGVVTRICGAAELQSDRGQDTNYSQKAAISSHARSPASSLSHPLPSSSSPSSSSSSPSAPPLPSLRRSMLECRDFLAVRFVSSAQAIFACICALAILRSCATNPRGVIYATHWATKFYVRFAAPYFLYDIWAMFRAFVEEERKHSSLLGNGIAAASNSSSTNQETPLSPPSPTTTTTKSSTSFSTFLRANPLIVLHHLFVPFVLFPGVVGPWRGERGDVIIASFFLLEASTPFVALRAVLHRLGLASSKLYVINGLLMLLVFGCCRILIFPFIYWIYAKNNITGVAMPLWQVRVGSGDDCFCFVFYILTEHDFYIVW